MAKIARLPATISTACGLYTRDVDVLGVIRFRRWIAKTATDSPDVVWCYGLSTFFMVPKQLRRTAIVYTDLVDFVGFRDVAVAELMEARWSVLRRFMRNRNIPALRRTSRIAIRGSRRSFISSETDRRALGGSGVEVLPNTSRPFQPALDRRILSSVPSFLFVGTLAYFPNQDAVEWLVSEIWPLVRLQLADAVVRVVGGGYTGRMPPPGSGVVMMGEVDDLRPHYSDAWAMLIPLRSGSGTRIKALEAWANNVPVVSTSKGVEGLGSTDGDTVLIADTAWDFAARVVQVAKDPVLGEEVAERAHGLCSRSYSTEVVSDQIRQMLDSDLAGRR